MARHDHARHLPWPYLTDATLLLSGWWKTGGIAFVGLNGRLSEKIPLTPPRFAAAAVMIEQSHRDFESAAATTTEPSHGGLEILAAIQGFRTKEVLRTLANSALRAADAARESIPDGEMGRTIYHLRHLLKPPGNLAGDWHLKFIQHVENYGYRFSTHPDNLLLHLKDPG